MTARHAHVRTPCTHVVARKWKHTATYHAKWHISREGADPEVEGGVV
jgi:hypothetical protein